VTEGAGEFSTSGLNFVDGEVDEADEILGEVSLLAGLFVTVTAFGTPRRATMGPFLVGGT
jgi:hypothetical protein